MKKFFAKLIFETASWLDSISGNISGYSYTITTPSHRHINGHEGKFTQSQYNKLPYSRLSGFARLTTKSPLFKIGNHHESGYYWNRPRLRIVVITEGLGIATTSKPVYGCKAYLKERKLTKSLLKQGNNRNQFTYKISVKIV